MSRTATRRPAPPISRREAGTSSVSSIAHLVTQARPEWDEHLVRTVLYSHVTQVDGNDLAIAALRAAGNPNLPHPKSIGWRGPHWDGLGTVPVTVEEPERCGVCGRREPECYSVRPGADDHVFEPVSS